MKRFFNKLLSLLLALTLLVSTTPMGALAANKNLTEPDETPRSGVFTAQNGDEYAVLYTDYIAVYVNKADGGFVVLPASEAFDDTQALSYATFLIDGAEYRYGTYYSGVTGEIGIAPEVNADNILESHQQIGDFIVSQYFAITRDTEHESSYVVKVGYSAEYFGGSEASIGGRILLDTQFTPEENIPVLLVDSADIPVLVETEAEVSPVPVSASISEEIIAEMGLTVAAPKGFLLFEDSSWSTADSVVFAERSHADGGLYEPDWEYTLFDGSGVDSAALLRWDAVSVSGGAVQFGVNYGFYGLEPSGAQDVYEEVTVLAAAEPLAVDTQSATVVVNHSQAPSDWFTVQSSLTLTDTENLGPNTLNGTVTAGEDFSFRLAFKPGTPEIIKNAIEQYHVWIAWDGSGEAGNGWPVSTMVDMEELYTLSGDYFKYRKDAEDLSVTLIPVIASSSGYTTLTTAATGVGAEAVQLSLTGGESDISLYDTTFSPTYIVRQGAALKLTAELRDSHYIVGEGYPSISWYGEETKTLTAESTDIQGLLTREYSFTVPDNAAEGGLTVGVAQRASDEALYPINVKAFTTTGTAQAIENTLWEAVSGTSVEGGLHWGTSNAAIAISENALSGYSGYEIHVYHAGTKTPVSTVGDDGKLSATGGSFSFNMPSGAIDIVFIDGTNYRVFTEAVTVEGAVPGTAAVTISPEKPKSGDMYVDVYVTNIQAGYQVASVTSNDVTLTAQLGGSWLFDMPDDSDVTITVTLEAIPPQGELHSVKVNPLVGDGRTLYNVMFWTDTAATGERAPYQVDEAGRIGKIRAGTKVYYVLYPTTWNEDANITNLPDMSAWTVDGLYLHGVDDANLLDAPFAGPAYFPSNYDPYNPLTTAGSFTMPAGDVTFDITGYKTEKTYTMTLEAYDLHGNRLTLPEGAVRSGTVNISSGFSDNYPTEWQAGLDVPALMSDYICMQAATNVGNGRLKEIYLEVDGERVEQADFLRRLP